LSLDVLVSTLALTVATAVTAGLFVPWLGAIVLQRVPRVPSVLWAALVLAPAVIAALVGVALLAPAPFGACHCAAHAPHHPHLCLAHPELAGPLSSPALALIAAWAAIVATRLWRVAADAFRAARWAKHLEGRPFEFDGVRARVADCGRPLAVATGVFTTEIIVDRSLWSALSSEERRVVVQHEHAHAVRRDGLTLLLLRAVAASALIPLHGRLIEAWRTSAELECDRHASAAVQDPLVVASTLLSVERLCGANSPGGDLARAVLGARPGGGLEQRVRALLDLRGNPSAGLANDVLVVSCLLVAGALLVFAWPSGSVHHALETLLGWALG
jgi:Zn-dependent protease with chaperone function